MSQLSRLIREMIAARNITRLLEYKSICDDLHDGASESEGFNSNEKPSDSLYEEMVRLIRKEKPEYF